MTKSGSNHLEFELDQPDIVLRGMVDDAQGAMFSGRLVVDLAEPIRVKGLKMVLEGHERLDWEYHNDGVISSVFHRESTPISHKWTFFAAGDGKKAETWSAGRHVFPFSVVFPGNLPESITLPYANVSYQLRATLRRTGFMANITSTHPVSVKRDLTVDGSFGTGAISVENCWRDKLDFCIVSDADTFTPGDTMSTRLTFQPLVKGMRLTKVGVMLKEYVRCHTQTGDAIKTVSRVASSVEAVPRMRGRELEDAAIRESMRESASAAPAYSARQASSGANRAADKNVPLLPGIELTDATSECLQLSIPTDPKRLQYDHISSYIEVTHKLKYSIYFRDPEGRSHTLWISVSVSVVPVILDTTHGPRAELPTYAHSSMDAKISVPTLDPSPPTYDTVITESLERAAYDTPISVEMSSTNSASSSSTSIHSGDDVVVPA
ncbi:hypothetical protein GGI15_003407, partial [Coemansia interrupta]